MEANQIQTVDQLNQFYQVLLGDLGVTVTDDGMLTLAVDGGGEPLCSKDGRRLVLPTDYQMTIPDWTHRVLFHPFSELQQSSETPTSRMLRRLAQLKLNDMMLNIIEVTFALAASNTEQKKLTARQGEIIGQLRVEPEFGEQLAKFIAKQEDPGSFVITSVPRRRVEHGGQHYARSTTIYSPMINAIQNGQDNTLVRKLGKRRTDDMRASLIALFPDLADPNGFAEGSMDMNYPAVESVLKAFSRIFRRCQEIIQLFPEHFSPADVQTLAWTNLLQLTDAERAVFQRVVSLVPANDGNIMKHSMNPGSAHAIHSGAHLQPVTVAAPPAPPTATAATPATATPAAADIPPWEPIPEPTVTQPVATKGISHAELIALQANKGQAVAQPLIKLADVPTSTTTQSTTQESQMRPAPNAKPGVNPFEVQAQQSGVNTTGQVIYAAYPGQAPFPVYPGQQIPAGAAQVQLQQQQAYGQPVMAQPAAVQPQQPMPVVNTTGAPAVFNVPGQGQVVAQPNAQMPPGSVYVGPAQQQQAPMQQQQMPAVGAYLAVNSTPWPGYFGVPGQPPIVVQPGQAVPPGMQYMGVAQQQMVPQMQGYPQPMPGYPQPMPQMQGYPQQMPGYPQPMPGYGMPYPVRASGR